MSTLAEQEPITPTKTRAGDFVWHELRTTNAKAAEEFYTHVIGWQAKSSGDPGGIPYTLLSVGDISTAGLMQLTPEMLQAGVKPSWAGFIGVDDVDAFAKRIQGAGGKLHCAPQDIHDRALRFRRRSTGRRFPPVQGISRIRAAKTAGREAGHCRLE